MRLVRLSAQSAKVSDDIRAALTSLGRGSTVIGGVALIGVRPHELGVSGAAASGSEGAAADDGGPAVVDAVVMLPRGVLIIVAVDLPDPAMRLTAPLTAQWKADGWPLVGTSEAVNPATDAVALAGAAEALLRPVLPAGLPVGTVVAVGPFVETVEVPPAELAGTTRVLYPTPTSMLAAAVSLASATEPCTVADASGLLRTLAPEARLPSAAALTAEGFTAGPATPPGALDTATPTVPAAHPGPPASKPRAPAAVPEAAGAAPPLVPAGPAASANLTAPGNTDGSATSPPPARTAPRARARGPARTRWLPFAALLLLLAMLVTAIIVATAADGGDAPGRDAPPFPRVAATPAAHVDGLDFAGHAAASAPDCAQHATGDLRAWLTDTGCSGLRRGSFETALDGRPIAVSVAVATFDTADQAHAFKLLADTPGTGTIDDLATETGGWPARRPTFESAAYTSVLAGSAVRLVQVGPLDGPSDPADPGLLRVAAAALTVPVPD